MTAFIDEHRDVYGVEPICRVLPIAPSSYRERVAQRRDQDLKPEVVRVFAENFGVYGVRKVWRQMNRRTADAGSGLAGGDPWQARAHHDRQQGCAVPARSRQPAVPCAGAEHAVGVGLYVATWAGFVYVAFVIDVYARYIVGWRVSRTAHASFVGASAARSPAS